MVIIIINANITNQQSPFLLSQHLTTVSSFYNVEVIIHFHEYYVIHIYNNISFGKILLYTFYVLYVPMS